jgi:hypothetical protein
VAQQEGALVEPFRRSPPMTSSLHLLALQDPHAGAMLSRV